MIAKITQTQFENLTSGQRYEVYARLHALLSQSIDNGENLYQYAIVLEDALKAKSVGAVH